MDVGDELMCKSLAFFLHSTVRSSSSCWFWVGSVIIILCHYRLQWQQWAAYVILLGLQYYCYQYLSHLLKPWLGYPAPNVMQLKLSVVRTWGKKNPALFFKLRSLLYCMFLLARHLDGNIKSVLLTNFSFLKS